MGREIKVEAAMLRLFLMMALLVLPAMADDVTDWMDEARTAYLAGKHDEAMQHLDYAAQLIRQMKGEKLEAALPAAPAGWTRDEAQSAGGAGFMGGATQAQASYERQKEDATSTCSIQIATDNPMLGMMLTAFASPMMLSASGQKLIKVGSQKAALDYDAGEQRGTIQIVVAQKVLVTVEGSGLSEEELRAFAAAVGYDVIAKVVQQQP